MRQHVTNNAPLPEGSEDAFGALAAVADQLPPVFIGSARGSTPSALGTSSVAQYHRRSAGRLVAACYGSPTSPVQRTGARQGGKDAGPMGEEPTMKRTRLLTAAAGLLVLTGCGNGAAPAEPSSEPSPMVETAEATPEAVEPADAAPVEGPSVRTYADMTAGELLTVKCADIIEGDLTARTSALMDDFIADPSGQTVDQVELAALQFEWSLVSMGAPPELATSVDEVVVPLEQLSSAFAGGGNETIETLSQRLAIVDMELSCSIPTSGGAAPAPVPDEGDVSAGCLAAPGDLVAQIEQALDAGQYLSATAAVEAPDGTLYLGGDIMRAEDEARVSSQDTWALVDGGLYAVSGSANEYSSLSDGRDVPGISAGDDYGVALQECIGAARD